ncbi:23S rRNA (guanine(745)-N(1))-methyltransferase [Shewanella sp. JM162201]|uniref:23S rRNA (Guanine(745)-N(1))-methyltransferase n=1 Tax=Shewanella jiangmenensis TaxID=2837387 RepID=A0ABS5V9A8_9GAMM|nr:23S rRNA (guanine(745)-N(1))-methyltransferase [Shewanella jiangmenensis]MBT1445618.1 23S rRNA (guanine(745)-N(1))-methyltransferase [Shewanella jiangmenensis]
MSSLGVFHQGLLSGFVCPLCRQPLSTAVNGVVCPGGHRFDTAKEGYTNLLPVQKKRSLDPGDNKEMMQARRLFLEAGFYQPLSDRLSEIIRQFSIRPARMLDLGCGEGYYTARLADALNAARTSDSGNFASGDADPSPNNLHASPRNVLASPCDVYGLDISKAALKYAAKRYKNIRFCVASSFDTPFADGFFDLLLRIYAPSKAAELARVITAGGYLLTVSAGPMHHFAIKQRIYDTPRLHEDKDEWLDGFEPVHTERLQWQLKLSEPQHILAFLEMTPYAWKFSEEARQELSLEPLSCELDFRINLQRRLG